MTLYYILLILVGISNDLMDRFVIFNEVVQRIGHW
jgi:hypothetical protein